MNVPRFPLETVARIDPGFWRFIQTLPTDQQEKLRMYGSVRYRPKYRRQSETARPGNSQAA